jgi:hypothetical protein
METRFVWNVISLIPNIVIAYKEGVSHLSMKDLQSD